MKAGLMEIADIFAINKSDRPDADLFEKNLHFRLAASFSTRTREVPIIRTIATEKKGIDELITAISKHQREEHNEKNILLLTDKAWQLLVLKRMKGVNKVQLKQQIEASVKNKNFNLYSFVEKYT